MQKDLWEEHFILRDLLLLVDYDHVVYYKPNEVPRTLKEGSDVLVLVFSTYFFDDHKKVKEIAVRLRPQIIISLSDEYGDKPEFEELSAHCSLFLRQYYFPPYYQNKEQPENILCIPLGYMTGMLPDRSSMTITPNKQKYSWSFVGTVGERWGRTTMLREWKNRFPNVGCIGKVRQPVDTYNYYHRSCFVPCVRGIESYDCLRNYEASICGAIPVVYLPSIEVRDRTFGKEESPPWIWVIRNNDTDWDHDGTYEPPEEMYQLINGDPNILAMRQLEVQQWWRRRVAGVVSHVRSSVTKCLQL